MKRILITGKGSYIGTNFKKYLAQFPNEYIVEELDMMNDSWKTFDFSNYDVVYHVAGIAHIKEKKENKELYFKINRDLAFEVALKSKNEKIKQFIFMSSMSVYGLEHYEKDICTNTKIMPKTNYGKSKYEAENMIEDLQDCNFHVCILRPPIVYGNEAPGNLEKLYRMARKIHIFPTIQNKRSSIKIERLIILIKEYIDNEDVGIFFPQNDEYMCTYEMVKSKMNQEGTLMFYTSIFNPLIQFLIGKNKLINKCFGNLVYEKQD